MQNNSSNLGVIFDLDGVLVDTGEFHKASWYDLAEKEGFEVNDDFFRETFGMQNYQIIPMLLKREVSDQEIERLADYKEESYRKIAAGKLELLDGVENFVHSLKSAGFKLAVGTSAPRENLEFMLKDTPIWDSFDAYVSAKDVTNGKPAPDTFLKAAEKINLAPGKCCVVEDAVVGITAAKSASMKVIAVTTTSKREKLKNADLIVDSLSEVSPDQVTKIIEDQPIHNNN